MDIDRIVAGSQRLIVRQRWFRRPIVVLQVTEQVPINYDPSDPYDIGPHQYTTRWRDARAEDLAVRTHILEGNDDGIL